MNTKTSYFLLSVLVFHFISCATLKPTENTVQKQVEDIYSATWKLVSVKLSPTENEIIPPIDRITIRFNREGNFSGYGGCNNFNGKFEIIDYNQLIITDLFATRRGCEISAIEISVIRALNEVDEFLIVGDKLFLKKGSEVLLSYTVENYHSEQG